MRACAFLLRMGMAQAADFGLLRTGLAQGCGRCGAEGVGVVGALHRLWVEGTMGAVVKAGARAAIAAVGRV